MNQIVVQNFLILFTVFLVHILPIFVVQLILIVIKRDVHWLSILSNLNLIWSLFWTNKSILITILTLEDLRLLLIHHVVLGLLSLDLGLKVVRLVLSDLMLQVFLSNALVWLSSLFTTFLLLRKWLLSLRHQTGHHVITRITVNLCCKLLTFRNRIREILSL